MTEKFSPVYCIVPPHMLKEIAERGTAKQKQWALKTINTSAQFRGVRQALAEVTALGAPAVLPEKQRVIYDAKKGSTLPGQSVRTEGSLPTGDVAIDEAYDGSGATYDLYKDIYGRTSIDDLGLRLDSTVHYEEGYDNAFWNGNQMVYGDGDENLPEKERLFNRFTIAIDIIGHELTHGVTQYEARLIYWEQPGALNESFSDVFGSLVKQRVLNQNANTADWIIGQGLFTSNVNGQGIRSMKEPGTAYNDPVLGQDPQPAHMRDYKSVSYDNGGVHINSGIPNRAFYNVAKEIGGFAWEKTGKIWYVTLRDKLQVTSNFQQAANLTYQAAEEIFGKESLEQKAVRKGWSDVGINIGDDGKTGCLLSPASLIRRR